MSTTGESGEGFDMAAAGASYVASRVAEFGLQTRVRYIVGAHELAMTRPAVPTAAPVACTIVANNYLAYARVLAASFRAQHPDGRMHVLIVDRPDPAIDYAAEPWITTFVDELDIPQLASMTFRYSILELSTAVKPYFLRFLHQRHDAPAVLYLDPDILVTAPLDELWALLGEHDVVLTPHITAPIEDAATPGERDFLLSGMYNLGFLGIACNERTLPLLDWWSRRLHRDCLHAVDRGLFVDQRWMDFAPSFLARVCVLRDPGYNVAYWNLPERRLERDAAGAWQVAGRPLRFFHFSGIVPGRPEVLSRYQNRYARGERPDLEPLFAEYEARLFAADHERLHRLAYGFGSFDDGIAIPALARRLLQQIDPEGRRWPDPFRSGGPDSYRAWLAAADEGDERVVLSRLAVAVWDTRADLHLVFPTLRDGSREAFARWLTGGRELDAEWLASTQESLRRRADGDDEGGRNERQTRIWDWLADEAIVPREHLDAATVATLNDEVAGSAAGPRLTRLGLMLHQLRSDLTQAYPDPAGRDRTPFAIWFVTSARVEYALPWSLVRPVLATLPLRTRAYALAWWWRNLTRVRAARRRALATRGAPRGSLSPVATTRGAAPAGVNVVGWASAPTGVGEACRGTLAALDAAELPYALWSLGNDQPIGESSVGAPYDVTLLHVNADMTPTVVRRLPSWMTAGRHRIGYWFWELAHFPLAYAPAFAQVDEVWAPTRFCLEAFRPLAPVPVRWVPPAVPLPQAKPLPRAALAVPEDRFLLVFAFDARSVPERKNPRGVLQALRLAMARSPRPLHLLIKANHADDCAPLLDELRERSRDLPVTWLTGSYTRTETMSLFATCDAYLSLHRSEGLGLPLIEAMMLGKPVIAPAYGGCADFLDEQTGWVIEHRLVALDAPHGPYPPGAVWADPDPHHAAELLLRVMQEPEARARKAAEASRRVLDLYGVEAAAARLRRELERIHEQRGARRPLASATEGRWREGREPQPAPLSAPAARDYGSVARR